MRKGRNVMEWTPEKAYAFLQEIYTDELMQQEKRHVFQLAQNKMKQLLRTDRKSVV